VSVALRTAFIPLLGLLAVGPFGLTPMLHGQDTLLTVRYLNGGLDVAHLPYGTRFKLVGSTALQNGRADAVRLMIRQVGQEDSVTGCWVRPFEQDGAGATQFEVLIRRVLRLERQYKLKVEFLQRVETDAREALSETVDQVVVELMRRGQTEFTSAEVIEIWSPAAKARLSQTLGKELVTLDLSTAGQCPNGAAPELIQLSRHDSLTIARAVQSRRGLAEDEQELATASEQFGNATHAPEYDSLQATLERGLGTDVSYTRGDVSALLNAFDRDEPIPSDSRDRLQEFLDAQPSQVLRPNETALLETLIDVSDKLENRLERVANAKANVERQDQTLAELDVLAQAYAIRTTAQLVEQSWTDTATVRALRIGTAFAFGGTLLGINSNAAPAPPGDVQGDIISLFLVRIHWGPRDKRFADAYSSAKARWTFDVGALFLSNLNYHGQKMEDLFAGITPALGIGWDANRFIAFHGGLLFYRQASPNPLNIDQSLGPFIAPYLAVGFDFDFVNLIRNAVTTK
jgi:hypothetical protein